MKWREIEREGERLSEKERDWGVIWDVERRGVEDMCPFIWLDEGFTLGDEDRYHIEVMSRLEGVGRLQDIVQE